MGHGGREVICSFCTKKMHKQKYLTKVFSYLFLFGLNAFLENFFIFIIRAHISNNSFEAEKKGMTNSSLNLQLLHNDFLSHDRTNYVNFKKE